MPTSSSSSSRVVLSGARVVHRRPRPRRPPWDGQLAVAARMEKVVRYTECRRNHAAAVGGHVVDGCMEFMASGEEGTAGALTCAACGCHRSFHRRQVVPDCCSNSASPR